MPLCVLMLWIGLAPNAFLQPSRRALEATFSEYRQRIEQPRVAQATLRPAPVMAATEPGQ